MDALLQEVRSAAERAISLSQSRPDTTLDYSASSFVLVEKMLAEAHEYVEALSALELDDLVRSIGCYLLESARRAMGGEYKWFQDREQPVLIVGEPKFHVALATWGKVRGRVMGDPGDNIPFHMSGFWDRATAALPGDRVLFI